ncbi:hypothetical protein [Hymenobacter psychrotolerans]|uniref:MlpB protein n=1 Tax=Hymenobacter psychrotolerans DSM 18569 TaxID=1121959 RepID=A0A1M7GZZ8_9BACT|nr:hypothetical protein [Hymenobacter psychrotolerans]SHM21982.1 hypothetical protein SAMN02746009_04137 [Hymenobacter psychrotolerans DSM 18569]
MKSITGFLIAAVSLVALACSPQQDSAQQAATSPIVVAADSVVPTAGSPNDPPHTGHATTPNAEKQEPTMTKDGLAKELVCMVNNAYMGKKQVPVSFQGRQYYGCCEMCVKTIKTQRQVRVAQDPLTGKEVDKSLAFIALDAAQQNGGVQYFESEDTYQQYLKKRTPTQ